MDNDFDAITDLQMLQQGVAVYRVKDGSIFLFSETVLSELLTKARESGTGKAIVFVRSGAES